MPRSQILSYSSDGQLMQINVHAGGGVAGAAVASYGYRPDGLRAWKQDAAGNRTFFYYDESGQLLAVQNQSDASTRATVMLVRVMHFEIQVFAPKLIRIRPSECLRV